MTQTKAQLIDGKSAEIEFSGGSAGVPAISFTGDTNTGIYSPGADQLALSTNGTGRLFVDANGKVGAGTAVPGSFNSAANQLVIGTGSGNQGATLFAGSTGESSLFFADSVGGSQGQIFYRHSNDSFGFVTNNGSASLNIDSSGRVGIGTSSPDHLLDIEASSPSIRVNSTVNNGVNSIFFGHSDDADAGAIRYWGSAAGLGDYANALTINTNGAQAIHIDSSQRVGIGTTSPTDLFSVGTLGTSTDAILTIGSSPSGSGQIYFGDGTGSDRYRGYIEYAHSSDYLAFATVGTVRMQIDSSGRLLVGTSSAISGSGANDNLQLVNSAGSILSVASSDTTISSGTRIGEIEFWGQPGSTWGNFATIGCFGDATAASGDNPGRLVFSVTRDGQASPTEAFRIGWQGYASFWGGNSDTVNITTQSGAGTANRLIWGGYSSSGPGNYGTNCFAVYTNGDVVNTNNSYTALSDIKLKENVVDANSQWDDIKALQVRNYNLKEGQTHTQIGLIAQEVEPISPGLVYESPDRDAEGNDLGTVTKSVNYSVLYMKAVKALQEAMERIETLEAKVAALETP